MIVMADKKAEKETKPEKKQEKAVNMPAKKREGPKPAVKPKAEVPKEEKRPEPKRPEARGERPAPRPRPKYKALLFNRWDVSDVKVNDLGLQKYLNLDPVIVPRTGGRNTTNPIHKKKIPLVERFMNRLMVPGHRGKKHKLTSGHCSGNTQLIYMATKRAFERIEQKSKKNPLQVLVEAVENAALLEEIAAYRMGGMIARKAVTVSPQRRYDLALRHLTQGIYKVNFKSKRPLENVIADELMLAANNDPKSFSIQEKQRIEKEAEGAR